MEPAETPPKPQRGREIMQCLISIYLKRGHMRSGCGVIILATLTVNVIVAKTLTPFISKAFRLSNFCYDSVLLMMSNDSIFRVICCPIVQLFELFVPQCTLLADFVKVANRNGKD